MTGGQRNARAVSYGHGTSAMSSGYVHGYHERENQRLSDQAGTLEQLLHGDTRYSAGSLVLEAGCGTGAQTVILARNSPEARFVSVDISPASLEAARRRTEDAGLTNVEFRQSDILDLPFEPQSFDHVFVCFVLEHFARPVEALLSLNALIRPGGSITVIEGDHGSTFFHPDCPEARQAVTCLVEAQKRSGGDAEIGRKLFPLLIEAGFGGVRVSPRFVYADASRPEMVEGFTRKTFAAMIEGVREQAIEAGLMDAAAFDRGIAGLYRAAEPDGVFCYTFFKAVAGV